MTPAEIRKRLEQGITIEDCRVRTYLRLEIGEEKITLGVFDTVDDAQEQKNLLTDALVVLFS